jgi:hypothetical protein
LTLPVSLWLPATDDGSLSVLTALGEGGGGEVGAALSDEAVDCGLPEPCDSVTLPFPDEPRLIARAPTTITPPTSRTTPPTTSPMISPVRDLGGGPCGYCP